jgi:tRNA threonylcarbamoyl adenosine modification protein YeaZ
MYCALIDTSGNSILVGTADFEGRVLSAVDVMHTKEIAARLAEYFAEALNAASLTIGEIEYICAGCGPGSFIGTRSGVSFANGLASTSGMRVLGVGSMEAAAAEQAYDAANVMVVREARRNSVFAGVYRKGDGGLRTLGENETSLDDLSDLVEGAAGLAREGSLVIITDSFAIRDAIGSQNGLRATVLLKPNVVDLRGIAMLAAARRGSAGDSAEVRYLRQPV